MEVIQLLTHTVSRYYSPLPPLLHNNTNHAAARSAIFGAATIGGKSWPEMRLYGTTRAAGIGSECSYRVDGPLSPRRRTEADESSHSSAWALSSATVRPLFRWLHISCFYTFCGACWAVFATRFGLYHVYGPLCGHRCVPCTSRDPSPLICTTDAHFCST